MREDLAGAETAYRRCRDTAVGIFGPDHPNVAILDENIAVNLRRQKRYSEAEALMRDSTARFVKAVGDQHPRYSVFLDGLGDVLMDKGDLAGAGVVYRRAVEFDEAKAKRHLSTSYTRMGDWLARTGHPEKGEPLLRKGLDALARSTPKGSPEMAEDQRLLGQCLVALRRFSEAESFLLPSYEMFQKTFGSAHRQTRESALALAALYDSWGRPADAARFKGTH
jgi:tetratricopeptide (TPR) repeat protein